MRYRSAAAEHLAWCDRNGLRVIGGRWDLEDPLTGLLLAALVDAHSAPVVLGVLCRRDWTDAVVEDVWWPSSYVDLVVNFRVGEERHMLLLEHKHLNSPSNQPGWRRKQKEGRPIYWQTEAALLEIDRVRDEQEPTYLGGPFNPRAFLHAVLLDARGRTLEETFELSEGLPVHRHDQWASISYEEFAKGLRSAYERTALGALTPLLSQLFASARERRHSEIQM